MKRYWLVLSSLLVSLTVQAQVKGLPDFTELVERQAPAVVNISTTQIQRSNRQGLPFEEGDPMFELFRRMVPQLPNAPRDSESKSLGSGFVISADGFILTNAHVVEGADDINVRLNDKREFRARIVGADKRTDVALIKIDAANLPTVRLGEVSQLKVGEWVIAIGSPFGFESSVTAGIVSAKGRSLPQENYVPFIQTDVAINPGNSGGPLFNMRGEVVGINSQIYSRSGGYMGLSFAIPIDVAMEVQRQLKSQGRVSRGRLGVVIQEMTKELAESLGLSKPAGAIVSAVEKGGPAEKAGIEAGDVILRFDNKPIGASADLPRIVATTPPGSKVAVQLWRKGGMREIPVSVGEVAEEKTARSPSRSPNPSLGAANRLGLVVSELTPVQRKELGVGGGLLIEDIRGNSQRADLRPGDVIVALINKGATTDIKSAAQFNKLLADFDKGANVTLLIRRGDAQSFVTIKGINGN